jgi:hypothetical protein
MDSYAKLRVPGTDVEFLIHSRHISSAHRPDPKKPTSVFVDHMLNSFELVCVLKPTETAREHLCDQP